LLRIIIIPSELFRHNQEEYKDGGKHFLIYKAEDGDIEIELNYDEHAPSLAPPVGTIIMKWKGRTVAPATEHAEESPEESVPFPTLTTSSAKTTPSPTFARLCLHAGVDLLAEQGISTERENSPPDRAHTLPDHEDNYPLTLADWTGEVSAEPPGPFDLVFLPRPNKPSTGLLAACELTPIARYGETESYEFCAKGVTLAIEDDDGNPQYYRGNAFVQLTDRGLTPGIQPPRRDRVNQLRHRLFRTGHFAVPDNQPRHEQANLTIPHGDPGPDETPGIQELTEGEVTAVIEELIEDPIEHMHGKRTYEIHRNMDGAVVVTRVPFQAAGWSGEADLTEEGNVNEQQHKFPAHITPTHTLSVPTLPGAASSLPTRASSSSPSYLLLQAR